MRASTPPTHCACSHRRRHPSRGARLCRPAILDIGLRMREQAEIIDRLLGTRSRSPTARNPLVEISRRLDGLEQRAAARIAEHKALATPRHCVDCGTLVPPLDIPVAHPGSRTSQTAPAPPRPTERRVDQHLTPTHAASTPAPTAMTLRPGQNQASPAAPNPDRSRSTNHADSAPPRPPQRPPPPRPAPHGLPPPTRN